MGLSMGVMTREGGVSFVDGAAFDGRPGTAAVARDFASDFLARARGEHRMRCPERVDDVVRLVVSELMTNADRYAPGPYLLELELTEESVRVTVWDTEPAPPTPRDPDPSRVGQHGLEIVLALCEGFEVEQRAGGKRVSALIATV